MNMNIKADFLSLSNVLRKTNYNYVVPLFQRRYSWTQDQYSILWNDAKKAVNENRIHFTGAIVLQHREKDPTAALYREIVIDGQQRLTTFTLLLAAMRNRIKEIEPESELLPIIEELIACPNYKKFGDVVEGIDEVRDGYFRIHPSDIDRKDYYHVILGNVEKAQKSSNIYQAYRYFYEQFKNMNLEKIKIFYSKFIENIGLVVIQLQNADNPYEVFSSLNQTGLRLTAADLIRNHIFEQIPESEQRKFYAEFYSPFELNFEELRTRIEQNALKKTKKVVKSPAIVTKYDPDTPTKFLYHLWAAREGRVFPVRTLVQEVTENIRGEENVKKFLEKIKTYSLFYRSFVLPEFEEDERVRQALEDLSRTGETTFHPLFLELFNARHEGRIDGSMLAELIRVVENFVVRRKLFGKKVEGLNKEFPRVFQKLKGDLTPKKLTYAIAETFTVAFPTNDEIKRAAVDAEFYGKGKNDVTRLLLIQLDRAYNHDKGVHYDDAEIEHILPQSWKNWRSYFSDSEVKKLENFPSIVNQLGNFTLINSDYNKEVSNRPFFEKKKEYLKSPYVLTREVAKMADFFPSAIEARTAELLDRILNDVYPDLVLKYGLERGRQKNNRAKNSRPVSLTINGQNVPLDPCTWKKVLLGVMDYFIENHPEAYAMFKATYPHEFRVTHPEFYSKLPNGDDFRTNKSAKSIKEVIARLLDVARLPQNYVVVEGDY